jgi:nitrite reductase/ring-hydroxylating ferredoxin subunit
MLPVLRSNELTAGVSPTQPEIVRVSAGVSEVLLARLVGGGVIAFAPVCPHQDTSLEDATVWDGNLRCPRHLYLYDPHTGENILPTRDALPGTLWKLRPGYLPVHRVEERDGWIWVADAPEPPPAAYDPEHERRPVGPPEVEAPAVSTPSGPVVHPPEDLTATSGAELEVVLTASLRPGHLWRADVAGELVVVSQRVDPGGGVFRVRLRAGAPGEATMRWIYARPWDVEPAEVRTFMVRIAPESS